MAFITSLLVLSASSSVLASPWGRPHGQSNIVWDGRIDDCFTVKDFDSTPPSPYSQGSVHGSKNLSGYIRLANVQPDLFDVPGKTKPFEVTIDDTSVFVPGGNAPQVGFRRTELNPASINGSSTLYVEGKRTVHWSVRADPARLLDFTHEYQNVFLETAAYDAHQFTMKTGTPYNNATKGRIPATQTLRIESSTNGGVSETTLFQTYYTLNDWHNFALELDFDKNTITGYYSKNKDSLKVVIPTKANNNAGGGLYHFGILKLPASGTGNGSVTISGYQASGINEGQYYGGIFIEDTSAQPVTTSVSPSWWKL